MANFDGQLIAQSNGRINYRLVLRPFQDCLIRLARLGAFQLARWILREKILIDGFSADRFEVRVTVEDHRA